MGHSHQFQDTAPTKFHEYCWPMDALADVSTARYGAIGSKVRSNAHFTRIRNVEVIAITDDNDWVDLGDMPSSCLDNLGGCSFSLSFWLRTLALHRDQVILEAANNKTKGGITFAYVSRNFQVTYRRDTKSWTAFWPNEHRIRWSKITILYSSAEKLEVHVDGRMVAFDKIDHENANVVMYAPYYGSYPLRIGKPRPARNDTIEFYVDELYYAEEYMLPIDRENIAWNKMCVIRSEQAHVLSWLNSTENAVDGVPETYVSFNVQYEEAYLQVHFGRIRSVSHVVIYTVDLPQSVVVLIGLDMSLDNASQCGNSMDVQAYSVHIMLCDNALLGQYVFVQQSDHGTSSELRLGEVQAYYDPSYIGCYEDDNTGHFALRQVSTIQECRYQCAEAEFQYTALTNDWRCLCRQQYDGLDVRHSCRIFLQDLTGADAHRTANNANDSYEQPTNHSKEISIFESAIFIKLSSITELKIDVDCRKNISRDFFNQYDGIFMTNELVSCDIALDEKYDGITFDVCYNSSASDDVSCDIMGIRYTVYAIFKSTDTYQISVRVSKLYYRASVTLTIAIIDKHEPLIAFNSVEHGDISRRISTDHAGECSTRDQRAIVGNETLIRSFFPDNTPADCTIFFGDNETDTVQVSQVQDLFFRHVYTNPGIYEVTIECCNELGCMWQPFTRCVTIELSDFSIEPYSVVYGTPSAFRWEIQGLVRPQFVLLVSGSMTSNNHHLGKSSYIRQPVFLSQDDPSRREIVLDYGKGEYSSEFMYQCQGYGVMYLLLFNSPQDVYKIATHFSVAFDVPDVQLDVHVEFERTDFRSLSPPDNVDAIQVETRRTFEILFAIANEIDTILVLTYVNEKSPHPGEVILFDNDEDKIIEDEESYNWHKREYSYEEAGKFNLGLRAVNEVGSSSKNYTFDVFELCKRPMVWVSGYGKSRDMPRIEYVDSVMIVTGLVTSICRVDELKTPAEFSWNVVRLLEGGGQEKIELPSGTGNSRIFKFRPTTNGLYRMEFVVDIRNEWIVEQGRDSIYVFVEKDEPRVKITGGAVRAHLLHEDLVLTASISTDNDNDGSNKTLQWKCRVPHKDFRDPISGQAFNFDPCNITSGDVDISVAGRDVFVNSSALRLGTLIFTAGFVTEEDKTIYDEQEVRVIGNISMEISVRCVINCGRFVGSSFTSTFQGVCENGFCLDNEEDLTFDWLLHQYSKDHMEYIIVDNFDKFKFTGNRGSTLVIQEGFLKKGSTYKLTASARSPYLLEETAFAGLLFETAMSPHDGTCEIIPSEGVAFETNFVVRCDYWKSGADENGQNKTSANSESTLSPGLFYRMWLSNGSDIHGGDIYFATDPLTPGMLLPEGPPETGHVWEVVVRVENRFKEYSTTSLFVKVLPSSQGISRSLSHGMSLIDSYINLDNPTQSNQMVITMATALKQITNDDEASSPTNVTKLRLHMGEALEKAALQLYTPEYTYQTMAAIDMATNVPREVDETTQGVMITAMSLTTDEIYRMAENPDLPQSDVLQTSTDAVSSSSYLIEAIYMYNEPQFERANSTKGNQRDANSSVANFTNAVVESLDTLSQGLLGRMIPGEPPVEISQHGVALHLERTTEDELGNKTISLNKGGFSLPSAPTMFADANYTSVDLKVIEYEVNPFIWDDKSTINSSVISVELYQANVTLISQTNTSEDFTYTISNVRGNYTEYLETVPDVSLFDARMPIMSRFDFDATSGETNVRMFLSVPKDCDATFAIYVQHQIWPTYDHFDIRILVPGDIKGESGETLLASTWFNPGNRLIDAEPRIIQRNESNYQNIALEATTYELYIPPDFINYTGMHHVLVSQYFGQNATGHPILGQSSQPFSFKIHTSTCQHWDIEHERWIGMGCKMDPMSLPEETTCHCNHLTDFGIDSFYVPINTITWDQLSLSQLQDNPLVLVTVCAMLVVYFILLFCMRRKDKDDIFRWSATPLVDNRPGDNIIYHMAICTGYARNSGTRSNIYFRLVGDNGHTTVRQLKDEYGKVFSSGSVINVLLHVPESLGNLVCLYIWHDSSGLGDDASWLLNRIIITDVQTGQVSTFLCNRWLAVDKDDGKVDRFLSVASEDSLLDFTNMFGYRRQKGLTDEHIWFSMFMRPTRSTFTRVQRLSCCLALLFAYLIANAMFYKTDSEAEKATYTVISFGPISFSLQQIYIGTISALVTLPANVIIINIFRKSRRSTDDGCLTRCCRPCRRQSIGQNNTNEIFKKKREELLSMLDEKSSKPLPWWCIYIAWVGVFLVTVTSAVFVILYSMEWGKEKSRDWLTSCLTSLSESVICIEPLKALGIAFVLSLFVRNSDIDEFSHANKERQDTQDEPLEVAKESPGQYAFTNDSNDYFAPLGYEDLLKVRERRRREKKMMALFYGIVVYSLFVAVALVLCFYVKSPVTYYLNARLQNIYANGQQEFLKIRTPDEFWTWTNTVFIEQIYPGSGGQRSNATFDRRFYRTNRPRIRQQRNVKGKCTIESLGENCGYSSVTETSIFEPGWKPRMLTGNRSIPEDPWEYKNSSDVQGTTFFGQHGIYGAGGYVAAFQSSKTAASALVGSLSRDHWLDKYTRVIFVEFDLFAPDSNLFSCVVFAIEFPETGGAEGRLIQQVFKPLKIFHTTSFTDKSAVTVFICWVSSCVFAICQIVSLIRRIAIQRWVFFKIPWNYFDVSLAITTLSSVVLMVICEVILTDKLGEIRKGTGQNLQATAVLYDSLNHIIAIVVFLSVVRFLKLLRFNQRMVLLSKTLKEAGNGLISWSLMATVIILGFSHAGYLFFHSSMESFKTVPDTLRLYFTTSIGSFPSETFTQTSSTFTQIFLLTFAVLNLAIIMNILIAVINDAFARADEERKNAENKFEMLDYLSTRLIERANNIGLLGNNKVQHAEDK
ncbi:polycystin-1-like protein 2 [Ptychodera flava]|uniref:polycystin-1-like protein 2 n=1 Tax=Ptychodera flava TaxID=63121 RepID=UPI00396A7CF5